MATLAPPRVHAVPPARRIGTVERAFELAGSGDFRTVAAIEKRLIAEQHEDVYDHLRGLFTRGQLREAIATAVPSADRKGGRA